MKPAYLITAILWLSMAGLAFAVAKRAAYWRLGRAAAPGPYGNPGKFGVGNLFSIPKRYFVDLHHVVARDPYIAKTHVATAGGAIGALVLVFVNYGFAIYSPWLDKLILLAALAMLVGAVFVWRRRHAKQVPARLSRGPWNTLPWMLGAFALGIALYTAVPAGAMSGAFALICALLIVAGAYTMTFGAARGGPMKHAVAGLLHLAFHPRQERFAADRTTWTGQGEATPPTALKLPDIEQQEYGVAKPVEFRWNQLLSFDACVQCGKCEAACPAFAAGQPLNPKKLIQDLVTGMAGGTDAAYAGSPTPGIPVGLHSGQPDGPIVSGLIEAQTLWSCTTCRACVQECPMLIEHVDAIVDMRRNQTLVHGTVPGKGPEVLANLRETGTMGGYDKAARYDWSVDLEAPVAQPGKRVDILLVAGEGAFDMRYQRTLRALVKVLNKAGVDYAVLGASEADTGDVARRLGDEATFRQMARQMMGTLATLQFGRIVTADPHVMHSLRNEYRALGARYEVLHHTTLLVELADQGRIEPKALDGLRDKRTTYHDPCYLGRYNGETDAPRKLLKTIGIRVVEMERSGMRGRCCGGGGGAPLTDIPGKQRIPDIRIADARAVGADVVAVGCPNCTAMLEGVVGPRPEVLDVAELVAAALE